MPRPKRQASGFNYVRLIGISSFAIVLVIIGFQFIQPFALFDIPEPEPEPDDETGNGGEVTDENRFSLNHYENHENYTFEFDVKVFRDEGEFYVYIEDYYLNLDKNYVFLSGNIKEEGIGIFDLDVGVNRFTRTHNFSGDYEYQFDFTWFDTINGDNVYHSTNITNFTTTIGNASNFIQKPVDNVELLDGNASLIGEYTNLTNVVLLAHMNETSGNSSTDSSTNNYTGSIYNHNEDIFFREGKFLTGCFNFDGADDYLEFNTTVNFTGNLTIDFWFKIDQFPQKDNNISIFCKNDSIFTGFYFDNKRELYAKFCIKNESGTIEDFQYNIDALVIHNNWYHMAFVLDNSTEMRIYLDGVELATNPVTNFDPKDINSTIILGSSVIGEPFAGDIDELRIMNQSTSDFTPINYFSISYLNDGYWFDFTSNASSSKLEFLFEMNATSVSTDFVSFDIASNYSYDDLLLNLTQEELLAYNFTSDSYDSINITNHNLNRSDYVADNGTIRAIFNFTGNISNYVIEFDLIITNLYYEANITDLDWSYYSDDSRIILFQDISTNTSQFIVEFNITENIEDIFESITYYEISLSEGNFSEDVNYTICFYNYTSDTWSLCDDMLEIIQLNTTNEVLFKINQVPMYAYEDIIEDMMESDRVTILFNFSSTSAKIYLDYISKEYYTMNRSDFESNSEFFDVQFYLNQEG